MLLITAKLLDPHRELTSQGLRTFSRKLVRVGLATSFGTSTIKRRIVVATAFCRT